MDTQLWLDLRGDMTHTETRSLVTWAPCVVGASSCSSTPILPFVTDLDALQLEDVGSGTEKRGPKPGTGRSSGL